MNNPLSEFGAWWRNNSDPDYNETPPPLDIRVWPPEDQPMGPPRVPGDTFLERVDGWLRNTFERQMDYALCTSAEAEKAKEIQAAKEAEVHPDVFKNAVEKAMERALAERAERLDNLLEATGLEMEPWQKRVFLAWMDSPMNIRSGRC